MRLGNLQHCFRTRDNLFDYDVQMMRALDERATYLRDYMQRLSELLIEEYASVGGNRNGGRRRRTLREN